MLEGDTTAPVLEPITGTAHQRRDAGDKKQPKIAKIALDALREVSSEQGVFRPESGAPFRATRRLP